MKVYKDIIIHGAQLFRHLKNQHASTEELSLATLPLVASQAAVRALSRREADEFGDSDFGLSALAEVDDDGDFGFDMLSAFGGPFGGEGEDAEPIAGGFDFLSAFGGGFGGDEDSSFGGADVLMGNIMGSMEQCGIDITDMATKALGAFMMSGASMDFSSPESFDAYGTILLALKDNDEVDCEVTDAPKLILAAEEYMQCSGMNHFFDPMDLEQNTALIQSIESQCKPITDMVVSMEIFSLEFDNIIDEDSKMSKLARPCLQTLLGDNKVGNSIRYLYNNMEKILGCFGKFGEDLPHCVMNNPPVVGGTAFSLPLSLEKKLSCVIGSNSASVIEEACEDMYISLDKCLPESGVNDVDSAISVCAKEEELSLGKLDFFGMDASVLTGNKIPEFCSKIFKEKGMDTKDLQARWEHYHKNREYGWTLKTIAVDASTESPEVAQAVPSVSVEFSKHADEEMSESIPADIPNVESLEWTNGEAAQTASENVSDKPKTRSFFLGGLVIVATVALALVVKYSNNALGRSPPTSKSSSNSNTMRNEKYVHVAVKMDGHDLA